jgi:hypothetical protein
MMPYLPERFDKDIPEPEPLDAEEQVAGIDRAVGHHA